MRKSKRDEKARRIGPRSGGKSRRSPKEMRKHGGLDFEADGRHEEVQKGRERETDWTLKQRKGTEEVQKGRESTADWTSKRKEATKKSKTPATLATQYSIA